ncbi:helix-turn-helix domain-containing protein [Sphingobacterium sp. UBA5996]|uniref:helix-turn-helix domain-containing protein n=1 Tax=Sphingobacterium sp. UBA5996 TaxID=1947505 RepID=UPI0025E08054|nr:helix-turn-helix domain-containing protein [Sphingobacterium sp. UBA5996]
MINFMLLLFFIVRYRRTRQMHRDISIVQEDERLIADLPDDNAAVPCEKDGLKQADVLMSKMTEDRLLEQFERAQAARFFLKKGVCLQDLADLLGTNPRYVSYILNRYVGLDFNNYIQQARIEYLIDCVERDPDLLSVKFSVLAEKAGFSSTSKFSSVFKAVKGIPPSEYFQRLRSSL